MEKTPIQAATDNRPALGANPDQIMKAFRALDAQLCGRLITEAAIIASPLRYRWTGKGKLGVVVGEICLRDATHKELSELEEAIELGQVEIYTMPRYYSGRQMSKNVVHQATGFPLDPDSHAARAQQERWQRIAQHIRASQCQEDN